MRRTEYTSYNSRFSITKIKGSSNWNLELITMSWPFYPLDHDHLGSFCYTFFFKIARVGGQTWYLLFSIYYLSQAAPYTTRQLRPPFLSFHFRLFQIGSDDEVDQLDVAGLQIWSSRRWSRHRTFSKISKFKRNYFETWTLFCRLVKNVTIGWFWSKLTFLNQLRLHWPKFNHWLLLLLIWLFKIWELLCYWERYYNFSAMGNCGKYWLTVI